jgi:hypothetical protein
MEYIYLFLFVLNVYEIFCFESLSFFIFIVMDNRDIFRKTSKVMLLLTVEIPLGSLLD